MTTQTGDPEKDTGGSPGSIGRGVEVLAGRAVGGQVDAVVVLVLRAIRRLWVPSLVLGMTWLLANDALASVRVQDLDSVGDLLGALLSPLAGIAAAIALRLLTSILGFLGALPRARAELFADDDRRTAVMARSADLMFLTGALRSLRFTAAARDVAAGRLGGVGRVALLVDRVESGLGPASAAVFVLVLLLRA